MLYRYLPAIIAVAAAGAFATSPLAAEQTVLTIELQERDTIISLADADLLDLPQISYETSTIWTKGTLTFSGPSLDSVLKSVSIAEGSIVLIALNGYQVTLPWHIVEESAPIVANRLNGEPFDIRQKGPLWLVFPYDSDPKYRDELVYALSIWQLSKIQLTE